MQDVKYTKPATLQEAVKILQETGPTARVLAGGTDIIVMARERRRDTSVFVDIKGIPETMAMKFDQNQGLRSGRSCEQKRHPPIGDVRVIEGGLEGFVFEQQPLSGF